MGPGLALSEHQKAFLSNQVKSLRNMELFARNPSDLRFHNQILSLYTNENIIQLRSSIHATCSYGATEDFVKYHDKVKPASPASNISWRRRRQIYDEKKLELPSKEISRPSSSDLLGRGQGGHPGTGNGDNLTSLYQRRFQSVQHNDHFKTYLKQRKNRLKSFITVKQQKTSSFWSDTTIRKVPSLQAMSEVSHLLSSLTSDPHFSGSDSSYYYSGTSRLVSGDSSTPSSSSHHSSILGPNISQSFNDTIRPRSDNDSDGHDGDNDASDNDNHDGNDNASENEQGSDGDGHQGEEGENDGDSDDIDLAEVSDNGGDDQDEGGLQLGAVGGAGRS